ncbi:hypothetical protein PG993_008269 [Apiospora rasikravindrae]|uniref:Uncharacterized protein n=1 Tax=Apiospora rasikravindrae TaxID=990691 RepID=A0ABR1T282_9PEZI
MGGDSLPQHHAEPPHVVVRGAGIDPGLPGGVFLHRCADDDEVENPPLALRHALCPRPIPPGVHGRQVPEDPTLAIAHRRMVPALARQVESLIRRGDCRVEDQAAGERGGDATGVGI